MNLRVEEAVQHTIEWRADYFSLANMNETALLPLVKKGLVYVSPFSDKRNRTIINLAMGRNIRVESSEDYLQLMMYTMER